MFKFLDYLASFDAADGHAFLLHLPPIRRAKLLYLPAPDVLLGQVPECIGGVNLVEDVRVIRGFTTPSPARTSENVTASISWSIAPVLSFQEASRTAMYAGTFVLLLLPAVAYWGSLVVDLTLFGALLPRRSTASWKRSSPPL
jgi:hypothetical protein